MKVYLNGFSCNTYVKYVILPAANNNCIICLFRAYTGRKQRKLFSEKTLNFDLRVMTKQKRSLIFQVISCLLKTFILLLMPDILIIMLQIRTPRSLARIWVTLHFLCRWCNVNNHRGGSVRVVFYSSKTSIDYVYNVYIYLFLTYIYDKFIPKRC